jgi:cytidylate kinase
VVIIGLAGPAGCGKDTVADILVRNHGYTRIAFADPLRAMALALDPIIYEESETGIVRLSELVGEGGWDWAKREFTEVRRTLQRLGKEVVRDHVGANFWVDTAMQRMQAEAAEKWVVTDCRFQNEAKAVVDYGGHVVKIVRPSVQPLPGAHSSEAGFDESLIECWLANSRSLDDLEEQVATLVEVLGIP